MSLPKLIDIETLFADPEFSSASISPDGTRIAYLAPAYGRTNVWVRGVHEEHTDAACVTHDDRRGIRTFRWTDDPRWLLYLQDTDGNEDWHLYRVDLENPDEPAVDLTPMAPGSRVLEVAAIGTAPGCVLVSMNRRQAYIDAFLVEVATGKTTVHREAPDPTVIHFFGHDGEAFLTRQAEDGTYEYAAVDAETGEARVFHRVAGLDHPLGVAPAHVTPDGTGLLIGSYTFGDDLHLSRVNVATGQETPAVGIEGRSICIAGAVSPGFPPALIVDGHTHELLAVRFVGEDRPTLYVVDPDFAPVYEALAALSDGVLATVSCDEDHRLWVATFTHDREPGLTYIYDHGTGESRLLFRPYPQLDPANMAPMQGVRIEARDGLPLHAFLTLPVGVDPVDLPLVLKVHGGPWWHDTWGYNREAQFFANRGYAVLQVNMRGSSGYGRMHTLGAVREFAGRMHDDLIDFADWAVEQGIADRERIGIFGGSYGGYAALIGVTVTPDYFAAAVNYCGISDFVNFMRTLPEWLRPQMTNNWYGYVGDPEDPDDAADMLARSAITMVDRIVTPLLVVQGANDVRVVQAEADNIVEELRARGVPVTYMVKDDEGHGFQNPENVIEMFHAIERHFAGHLGGREA